MIYAALLAIVATIIAVVAMRANPDFRIRAAAPFAAAGGVVVFLVCALMSAVTTIETGKVGVLTLWGKVVPYTIGEGVHLINPFCQVTEMVVQTRNYTMSAVSSEGQKSGDDSIKALSSDQLQMSVDCTVFYHLDPAHAAEVFQQVGAEVDDKIARPYIREALYNCARSWTATELWTTQRGAYVNAVTKALQEGLGQRSIILEKVLVRNIDPPVTLKNAIEAKMKADQEQQQMVFVLQKEKQEAERKRVEATGTAAAQQILSASLTSQILENKRLDTLKDIGAKGNLIITTMGGAQPLINIQKK